MNGYTGAVRPHNDAMWHQERKEPWHALQPGRASCAEAARHAKNTWPRRGRHTGQGQRDPQTGSRKARELGSVGTTRRVTVSLRKEHGPEMVVTAVPQCER